MRRCSCRCTHCIDMGNVPKKEKHEVVVAPSIQGSKVRPLNESERSVVGGALVEIQQAAVRELDSVRNFVGDVAQRLRSV